LLYAATKASIRSRTCWGEVKLLPASACRDKMLNHYCPVKRWVDLRGAMMDRAFHDL
jgi:hypothetical protein